MKIQHFIVLALAFVFAACTKDLNEASVEGGKFTTSEKIINCGEGALSGTIAVKLSEERALEVETSATRAGETRSGVESIDLQLDRIDASRFVRIFNDPKYESRLREAGLHRWYAVEFPKSVNLYDAANALSLSEGVEFVEFVHPRNAVRSEGVSVEAGAATRSIAGPNDAEFARQWNLYNDGSVEGYVEGADVNALKAWDICSGDESVVVAVLDQPMQLDHPDFVENLWHNPNPDESELLHGANFCTVYTNGEPVNWTNTSSKGAVFNHGSHVAGIVGAVTGNGIGVAGVAGGKDGKGGVKLMCCQVFAYDANGNDITNDYPRATAEALIWAANRGAHIAQCSLGYSISISEGGWYGQFGFEKEAIDYFVETPRESGPISGGIVVFAAGNDGNSLYYGSLVADRKMFPAAYPGVIAVAGIGPDFTPGGYSNYGSWVDIAAPGGDGDIYGESGKIYSVFNQGGYGYIEGTSMACPHVSGVAALGLSYAVKLGKRFTPAEFTSLILSSANSIEDYLEGEKVTQGWNFDTSRYQDVTINLDNYRGKMGAGAIDAYRMLMAVEGTPSLTVKVGEESVINLEKLFGGIVDVEGMTFTVSPVVADNPTQTLAEALGFSYTVEGSSLKVKCDKVGAEKILIQCNVGDTLVEHTFAIVARGAVTNNGGWL